MIIGYFIDIWNWVYTRSRINLLKNAKEMWTVYKLRLSILGILYTIVEVDKAAVPENMIGRFLIGKLRPIDDALVAINLDGLIRFEFVMYAEDDVLWYVLVKFIPIMPHWTWWYFMKSIVGGGVIYWVITYFDLIDRFKAVIVQWI